MGSCEPSADENPCHPSHLSGPWGDLNENFMTYLLLLSSRASVAHFSLVRVGRGDKARVPCPNVVGGAWELLEEPAQPGLKFLKTLCLTLSSAWPEMS